METFDAAHELIVSEVKSGDLVLTMGAGDVTRLSGVLVGALGG
jgi:UDP-N-acetylmuramate-alanine ligase